MDSMSSDATGNATGNPERRPDGDEVPERVDAGQIQDVAQHGEDDDPEDDADRRPWPPNRSVPPSTQARDGLQLVACAVGRQREPSIGR